MESWGFCARIAHGGKMTIFRNNRAFYGAFFLALAAFACAAPRKIVKPVGCAPCRESDLVEIVRLDPTIRLDIRYATAGNFTGRPVYPEARAFLQRPAAEALLAVQRRLAEQGLGLVVYDAYRPWSVTRLFWEITPPGKHKFVADPAKGSKHNRGCAVDVGLVKLAGGRVLEMPGAYDEMSERSHVGFPGGTAEQRANRDLLRSVMERDGLFAVYPEEWWHFDFHDYRSYPVMDIPFSAIPAMAEAGGSVLFERLEKLLPDGFSRPQQPQFYGTAEKRLKDGSIFDYMDGGGVAWLEHGFQEMFHAEYAGKDGLAVTLDVFAMDTPDHARTALADERICPAGGASAPFAPGGRVFRFPPDYYTYFPVKRLIVYIHVNDDRQGALLDRFAVDVRIMVEEGSK